MSGDDSNLCAGHFYPLRLQEIAADIVRGPRTYRAPVSLQLVDALYRCFVTRGNGIAQALLDLASARHDYRIVWLTADRFADDASLTVSFESRRLASSSNSERRRSLATHELDELKRMIAHLKERTKWSVVLDEDGTE